eukprot:96503_1
MVANCVKGINDRTSRFCSVPDDYVKQYLSERYNLYNNIAKKINEGSQEVAHLFRCKKQLDGRVIYEYGVFFRYFDEFDYKSRNIFMSREQLFGSINGEEPILKWYGKDIHINEDHPNISKAFAEIIKSADETFPTTILTKLARRKIIDTPNAIRIEFYCKAKACPSDFDLCLSKTVMKDKELINFYGNTKSNNEACLHVSGFQQQGINDNTDIKLDDMEKVGEVYSNVLTMASFINDSNIDKILTGNETRGIYNINNLKNKNKKLKE